MINKTGSALTYTERKRQIEKEGWSIVHDDNHDEFELGFAALCYEQLPHERDIVGANNRLSLDTAVPDNWPWDDDYWKPTPDDRVKELVKSGALYRAEIERLTRRLEKVHSKIDNLLRIDQPLTTNHP